MAAVSVKRSNLFISLLNILHSRGICDSIQADFFKLECFYLGQLNWPQQSKHGLFTFLRGKLTAERTFSVCFEIEFSCPFSAVSVETHARTCAFARPTSTSFEGSVAIAWICSVWTWSSHGGNKILRCSWVATRDWKCMENKYLKK